MQVTSWTLSCIVRIDLNTCMMMRSPIIYDMQTGPAGHLAICIGLLFDFVIPNDNNSNKDVRGAGPAVA